MKKLYMRTTIGSSEGTVLLSSLTSQLRLDILKVIYFGWVSMILPNLQVGKITNTILI